MTEQIKKQGILPLFYHSEIAVCRQVLAALYRAGVRAVEFTNRGENALGLFEVLLRENEMPDMLLGIGTIRNVKEAERFIEKGAKLIISPGVDVATGNYVLSTGAAWIPGCMTPSEIMKAAQTGADYIKVFPGNLLGPSFVRSMKELFPDLQFMPTGGVKPEMESLQSWFDAGVFAVGMGSALINNSSFAEKNWADLELRTRKLLEMVKTIKRRMQNAE